MTIQWLLAWHNLIFIAPLLLALLYVGLYAVTGIGAGEGADADHDVDHDVDAEADFHADADVHADADADVDAHVDADADVDGDADVHADADAHDHAHAEANGGGSPLSTMLTLLGVGRTPFSIVMVVLLMTWGIIGFLTNVILLQKSSTGPIVSLLPIGLAAVGSLVLTRGLSGFLGRVMPTNETYARRRHDLLGSVGEAILPVDSSFGMAAVRDDHGDLFQVACRLQGERAALPKGAKVRLVAYNGKSGIYNVVEHNPAAVNRSA
jgi:hypothetical protein